MDKKILKQLKADYEELNIKPSVNLWDQIEDQLQGRDETVRKPLFQWWKYAAVVLLLIAFGSIFYFNSGKFSKSTQTIAVRSTEDENLNPSKASEIIANSANPETKYDVGIKMIPEKANSIKKSEEAVEERSITEEVSVSKNLAVIPEIDIKPEAEFGKIKQETTESPQLVVTEKPSKVKYVTANDLIFQRKYSIEKNDKSNENTKRLGIIMINKINAPEVITIFNSSNSTNE
ncbi:hypothetical protein [Chryseobacterium sp. RLHN22]|uniref:hypothetical protein n=1 Tax=Chryseobacterium sp. RLHN22 TaxID=3437885 RepID=UPI003D9AC6B8